jgi:hypothetical protein
MGKHGKSMKTIKGPAVFLAQFVDKSAPFNSLDGMCKWAADLGYKGIQIPTWESFLIDLDKAAESQTYCDELKGKINSYGLEITELSTHLQGQLVAVHPAYDLMFDNCGTPGTPGLSDPTAWLNWDSKNSPTDGYPFSIPLMKMVLTFVTKYILVKTFTMGSPLNGFSKLLAIIKE